MQKISHVSVLVLVFFMSLVVFPKFSLAHGDATDFEDIKTGSAMMRHIEDQALGEKTHEEIEDLMEKMMTGDMTEEEVKRMTKLMNENPGPYSMMMGRMMGMGRDANIGSPWGMMPWGGMMGGAGFWSAGSWFTGLLYIVWLVLGILGIIWLSQKITKSSRKTG